MKILSFLLFSIFVVIIFSSCRSQKPRGYVEDFTDTSAKVEVKYSEPLIQKGDVLSIVVYSDAIDGGATDAMFNLANKGTGDASTQGFLVDLDGNIQYPRIGKIKAGGLTKTQLSEEIRKKLTGPLQNPSVLVHLLNYKITMLGQVSRPGPITIPSEKMTILEAIGLAGGITDYGKKEEVVILRPTDSTIEHGTIDLSSKKVFESPYYFLRQNDVVLVNPNKYAARLGEQVFNQRLGLAFSVINMLILLYSISSGF
jgi:polysaccharide export outer membrane protein